MRNQFSRSCSRNIPSVGWKTTLFPLDFMQNHPSIPVNRKSATDVMVDAIRHYPPIHRDHTANPTHVVRLHPASTGLLRLKAEDVPSEKFGAWEPSEHFQDTMRSSTSLSTIPGMVQDFSYGNPLFEVKDKNAIPPQWRDFGEANHFTSRISVVLNQPGISLEEMYMRTCDAFGEHFLPKIGKRPEDVTFEDGIESGWLPSASLYVQKQLLGLGEKGWEKFFKQAKTLLESDHIVDFHMRTNNIRYLPPSETAPHGELLLIDTNPPTQSRLSVVSRDKAVKTALEISNLDMLMRHILCQTTPMDLQPWERQMPDMRAFDPFWADKLIPNQATADLYKMISEAAVKAGYPIETTEIAQFFASKMPTPEPDAQSMDPNKIDTGKYMLDEIERRGKRIYANHVNFR